MLADYHVHTGFSDDSTYPLRQVALDAVRLNLDEICFTEHVDYGVKPEWDEPANARFEDGHPVTNCPYEPYGDYPFERVRDVVAEVLRQVVADGKGIEVNTSGIRYGLGDFQPSRQILELYRDLGGRVVTVGSDSHKPEHLGSYLRLAHRELAELGFEGVWTFRCHEGELHRF